MFTVAQKITAQFCLPPPLMSAELLWVLGDTKLVKARIPLWLIRQGLIDSLFGYPPAFNR